VEQGGNNGASVQVQVSKEKGGFQRMGDVRFTRLAGLALVAGSGIFVGLPYQVCLVLGQVARYPLKQGFGFLYSYPMSFNPSPMIIYVWLQVQMILTGSVDAFYPFLGENSMGTHRGVPLLQYEYRSPGLTGGVSI
jgi:hypothetical protein